jgi:hypothetical protein
MRKSITTCLMLVIFLSAVGQQTEVTQPVLSKSDYLQKSKKQKTAAWILAGGGFALTTIGAAMVAADGVEEIAGLFEPEVSDGGGDAGTAFMITGLAAIGGSIPLFIAAGRNKRKGMELSFKNERIPQLRNNNFVYSSIPSLSFKISL